MNWNNWIRQIHRWLSIAFTVTVIANFVALARGTPPAWVTYSPLPPARLAPVHRSVPVRAAVCHAAATHRASSRNEEQP